MGVDIETVVGRLLASAYSRSRMYTEHRGRRLPIRWIFFRLRKYINNFLRGDRLNRLILMPGLRGVGKTTLLWQLYRFLVEERKIDPRNILVISADELKMLGFNVLDALQAYERLIGKPLDALDHDVFIFIDEATFDEQWQLAVKSAIYDRTDRVFTLVTGSSALALRITTDLARRSTIERLFPLNYSEYLMIKFGAVPLRGFTSRLRSAVFASGKAEEAYNRLRELRSDLLHLQMKLKGIDLKGHLETFLKIGGLPFSALEGEESLPRVYDVVKRVLFHDLPALYSFDRDTCEGAMRILALFATSHPERISVSNLSRDIGLSRKTVYSVLQALVDSELIFPVPPYTKGRSLARKPKKYYFTTPTLRAAILQALGWILDTKDTLAAMLEDAVAATLYRLKYTGSLVGLHYDPEGADLIAIARTSIGPHPIPVEVGWGRKDRKQAEKSVRRFEAPYAVIVDDSDSPHVRDSVVWIPKHIFLLL